MRLEILIYADVKIDEDDDIEELKSEIKNQLRKSMSRFGGSPNTGPYQHNGMYDYLDNVDYEESFDDEGVYDFISKKYDPEQYAEKIKELE